MVLYSVFVSSKLEIVLYIYKYIFCCVLKHDLFFFLQKIEY